MKIKHIFNFAKDLCKLNPKGADTTLKLYGPQFYRKRVFKKYVKPIPVYSHKDFSYKALLCRDGIVEIKDFLKFDLSEFKKVINSENHIDQHKARDFDMFRYEIGNEKLKKDINKSIITDILKFYLQVQFWPRENPFIMHHRSSKASFNIQSKFHLDGYNQMTLMILLNDLDENSTHMEYAIRSHRDFSPEDSYDRNDINEEHIIERYQMKQLIGKANTAFLFDAGRGFHRAVSKFTERIAIFQNYSTGVFSS